MKKKPKIVATIEARMTSSRLPGKVLLPAAGRPMLEHLVRRLKKVPSISQIVLATTINKTDDILAKFAKKHSIAFFRGSEEDVMKRVLDAAEMAKADIIVEITGDCPIIDPLIVEQCVQMFLNNDCDYLSNVIIRSYPIGMDTQVFPLAVLRRSAAMTQDPSDREHVSLHICKHPELFRQIHLLPPPDLYWPELGLTLDEKDDYFLLKKIIEHFYKKNPDFSCGDVLALLRKYPQWIKINKHVKRKGTE